MPKLRSSLDSFMDAQRHTTIGRTRVDKNNYNPILGKKLDNIMTLFAEVIAIVEKETKSPLLNKDLFSAATKIEKELERNNIKIDYAPIVKEIYSANSQQKALTIGLQHGIERNDVVQLMYRAPIKTNLGKVMAVLKEKALAEKAAKEQSTPIEAPAVTTPIPDEPNGFEQDEEQNTIDSDAEIDDNLNRLLGGKQ